MSKHLELSAEIVEQPVGRPLTVEHLDCRLDLTYNWGYEKTRQDLRDLYKKAQRSQWQPDITLPWDTSVDLDKPQYPEELFPLHGSDIYRRMSEAERGKVAQELFSWVTSQFLHGEQGALLAASQLVVSVPDMDSKYYATTQVFDEGRHVEVYDRYLHEKIGFSYPISPYLKKLLDQSTDLRPAPTGRPSRLRPRIANSLLRPVGTAPARPQRLGRPPARH